MEQTSKTPWGTTEGLYDPSFEHDNCGIGAIVNIKGTVKLTILDSEYHAASSTLLEKVQKN